MPDLPAFIAGIVAGIILTNLLYFLAYLRREQLGKLRDQLLGKFGDVRQRLSSGTETRYRQDLLANLQQKHLAGSILNLEEILVPPRFILGPPPFQPSEEGEYEPDISEAVPVSPDLPFLGAVYQAPFRTTRDITLNTDDVVLIGRLGSGKSTALQHIAIEAARRNAQYFSEPVFPVYIHLGDLPLPLPKKADLTATFNEAVLKQVSALVASALPGYLETQLKNGRVLVLVDGLDELPDAQQPAALDWFKAFRSAHSNNRFIITCGLHRYHALLELGLAPAYMSGWSVDNARELVNRWVEIWPSVLKAQKRKYNPDDEPDPALAAGWLSGNTAGRTPFEITLKAWTGLAGDAEGPRQTDWLTTYVKRLQIAAEVGPALEELAMITLKEGTYGVDRNELRKQIATMAAALPDNERSIYDPLDLVDELGSRKGSLLVHRANDMYTFRHPLVRGYLAARALRTEGSALLVENQNNPDWYPVQTPFAVLNDATPLAAVYLKSEVDILYSGLFQTAGWLADAPPKARWRGEVLRRLAQVMMTKFAPIELRGRALAALVASQDENVLKLFQQGVSSDDPLVRQFACVGLGAVGDAKAAPKISELLHDSDLQVRWAAAMSLALIGNDLALETIGGILLQGDPQISTALGQALALNPTEGHPMLRDALGDGHEMVRRAAVEGVRRIGPEDWILEGLDYIFREDSDWIVRNAAEAALNELREQPAKSPVVMPPPDETAWLLTWYAKQGKAVQPGLAGRAALREALNSDDELVQIAAADHLGRIADSESIEVLKNVNRQSQDNIEIREMTYQALTSIARATGEMIPF